MDGFKYGNIKKYIKQCLYPYITNIILLFNDSFIYRPKLCPGTIQPYFGQLKDKHPVYKDIVYTDWWLCDGTNNTPDLRNKFIIGCETILGETGGNLEHNHILSINSTGTIGSTSLTINQIPKHTAEGTALFP